MIQRCALYKVVTSVLMFIAASARAENIPLSEEIWEGLASEDSAIVNYKGEPALSLFNDTTWVRGSDFESGVIEFKVSFTKDRGFVGVKFRAQDSENYEHFYIRPHQSGMPDANQYTPVFHGNSGWQIYYGARYSAPVAYPYGEWVDVKLVISGDKADIYINSEAPILHVADLKREQASGAVGFDSFLTNAFIKDVRITSQKNPKLIGKAAALPDLSGHGIETWRVSQPMPPIQNPADSAEMESALTAATWRDLRVDENGIANLGRIGEVTNEKKVIFAKLIVHADQEMIKRLAFGYSDRATVWVNRAPVYTGDNTYRSRDYRYLGTVGLFDALLLPLKEGENEIIFAIEESFGGWALMAAFEDMEGIESQ